MALTASPLAGQERSYDELMSIVAGNAEGMAKSLERVAYLFSENGGKGSRSEMQYVGMQAAAATFSLGAACGSDAGVASEVAGTFFIPLDEAQQAVRDLITRLESLSNANLEAEMDLLARRLVLTAREVRTATAGVIEKCDRIR